MPAKYADTRIIALKVLIKTLEKKNFVDEVLNFYSDKVFSSAELINLTSGAIKQKLTLDFFIQNISQRKLKDLSYPVLNTLRLAVYELEYLKNPDYAVINSYVEIIKKYDKKAGSFVNGVLRNFIRKRANITFPEIEENPVYAISVKYSHPEWMIERWIKNYGIEDTIKICEYNNLAPKLVIRANTLKISTNNLMEFFHNNLSFAHSKICDECLILEYQGNIREIPGFNEGYWVVQSESSCLVSKILDTREGEKILDFCAAPGGKTTHIAALTHDRSEITAIDINLSRLKKINENCQRLGVKSVKTQSCDAVKYLPKEKFDRILVDAPCSNTGVLSKRVDARWNKTSEDIKKLAELQLKILNNAAKLVKSQGTLVYSTCSIEPEENQAVIKKFLEANKNFTPDKISSYIPWNMDKDEGYFQILQSRQNIDGFFIAKLKNSFRA